MKVYGYVPRDAYVHIRGKDEDTVLLEFGQLYDNSEKDTLEITLDEALLIVNFIESDGEEMILNKYRLCIMRNIRVLSERIISVCGVKYCMNSDDFVDELRSVVNIIRYSPDDCEKEE